MEKITLRKKVDVNKLNNFLAFLSPIVKSRYSYFLLGFISLIIISNNYNDKLSNREYFTKPVAEKTYVSAGLGGVSSNSLPDQLVEFALDLKGVPYTAAGKIPSTGFDCSGFTSYVYKNFGFEIPPSSITQSEFGKSVDVNFAEKGDLIFFKSPTEGNESIGHVGIVTSNSNGLVEFVHSSSSRGVVVDNLDSKHYKARFRSIRRVF